MKIVYIDTETTGLDPKVHAVWQIGLIIEIDGVEKERREFLVKPFPGDMVAKEVLEMNGMTMEEFRNKMAQAMEGPAVYAEMCGIFAKYVDKYQKTDKFFFAAYNATFDDSFLRRLWEKCNDVYYGSWFWWPPLDVAILACEYLLKERHRLVNFKLETVGKHLGINIPGEAHDAIHDILLTRAIYQRVRHTSILEDLDAIDELVAEGEADAANHS